MSATTITSHQTGADRGEATLPVIRSLTVSYVLSVSVAILLVITSVAGLLFGQQGFYEPDPATLPTFLGQDAVTLMAGLPLLLGSMWAARRGSLRGLLLWLGALFYFAYSYAYYATVFNAFFLVYIAIISMSLYGLLFLLLSVDAEAVRTRFSDRTPTRLTGGFLAMMMGLFGLAWDASIAATLGAGADPTAVQRIVWPLDLVVAFPAGFWGGVWLWRRQPLGYVVAPLLLLKLGLLGCTLSLNAWLVTRWGMTLDPFTPGYAIGGMISLLLAVLFLRRVIPGTSGDQMTSDSRVHAVG